MRPAYKVTVQPSIEPVSVTEATEFLRVDAISEAPQVGSLVATAREYVEQQTGRAFITQTITQTRSCWSLAGEDCRDRIIFLERTPLASVVSVEYYPEGSDTLTTLDTSVYGVVTVAEPGYIFRKDGQDWPALANRPDAVKITFTAGADAASSVPRQCRQAIMQLTKHWYDAGRDPVNIGNIVNDVPYTLKALLDSQRVGGWVA